ncbi:MAG: HAD-IA family hydrolase [Acidimicrobiales bacterium]|nr:HAD-IA family hydrolase [Acidimicrobiales bacterium]
MNTERRGSCEFQRFLLVVLAQDVRVAKPDRRIFQITAQRAGCPLAQLLHVGDSLEQDVAGACAAGAHTVWLNREGLSNDTGIKADYEISSLTDLPEILGVG